MNIENFMPVDYVLLVLIALSAFVGLWRGFVKEAFSLITWIAAISLAIMFREYPAQLLEPYVANEMVSLALGGFIIFILTMLIGGTIAKVLKNIINKSNLGFVNRIMGLVFGVLRALVIIVGLSIMINFILSLLSKNLDDFTWWSEGELTPYVEQFEDKAFDRMMEQYQERKAESDANGEPSTTEGEKAEGAEKEKGAQSGKSDTNEPKMNLLKSILNVS